jgi:chromosome partitioning protein
MSKVIGIISQKGGVGKTTTCRNLATGLQKQGYKVLAVDCDSSANMTECFGIENPEQLSHTLYHLMMAVITDEDMPEKEMFIQRREGVDVIPSSIELSAVEINLTSAISREFILKTVIDEVKDDYDYVLLDGLPSLGLLTLNILAACDSVLIPATPEYLSAKGMELLLRTIFKLKKRVNTGIQFEGILLTKYEEKTNLSKKILKMINDSYGENIKVFNTKIPKTVKVGEANLNSMSIIDFMPKNKAAIAYTEFTKELIINDRKED